MNICFITKIMKKEGPTEIRTRVVGFRVPCDSHYTIGPIDINVDKHINFKVLVENLFVSKEIAYYTNNKYNRHQIIQYFCNNNHLFVLIPPPIAFLTRPGFYPPGPLM